MKSLASPQGQGVPQTIPRLHSMYSANLVTNVKVRRSGKREKVSVGAVDVPVGIDFLYLL